MCSQSIIIIMYQFKMRKFLSFCFSEVSENNVLSILCKLNSSKATGLDLLSPRFIKDGAKFIVSPLTHILNLSLSTGEIPENLKSAKVMPIYKKNSKLEAGNYRPISILNTLSKLFERIVYHISKHISYCMNISQALDPLILLKHV